MDGILCHVETNERAHPDVSNSIREAFRGKENEEAYDVVFDHVSPILEKNIWLENLCESPNNNEIPVAVKNVILGYHPQDRSIAAL